MGGVIVEQNPDFGSVMRNILQPEVKGGNIYMPGVTHSGGERQEFDAHRKGRPRHGGVDMNYRGSSGLSLGQNGLNLNHPVVGSPVEGDVTNYDDKWGMVEVTDKDGYKHQILHLIGIPDVIKTNPNSSSPKPHVKAGQFIGHMGGKGPNGANQYDQHVHYQVLTPNKHDNDKGEAIDPETYWNNPGSYRSKPKDFSTQYLLTNPPVGRPSSSLLRQGHGVTGAAGNGETLRRENVDWRVVHRVEGDGSGRGSFISE